MFLKSTGSKFSPVFRKGIGYAGAVSKGLGSASRSLATGARVGSELGNTILSIPGVRTYMRYHPEAKDVLDRLNTGAELASAGSQVLGRASVLTDPKMYRPIITSKGGLDTRSLGKNIRTGIERAKMLDSATEPLIKFVR